LRLLQEAEDAGAAVRAQSQFPRTEHTSKLFVTNRI